MITCTGIPASATAAAVNVAVKVLPAHRAQDPDAERLLEALAAFQA